MQIFQTNYCKIITPCKTFDLQNESDEQFTDMKFMFSRYELKTINKRLVRGRNQSASEGEFMGSMAPYGYRPYKLQNPFAGILVCGKCGTIMKRTIPDKRRNPTPWFRCTTRGCDRKIIKCEVVENGIRDAMQEWLDEYTIQIEADQQPKVDPIATALEAVRGQPAQLQLQQENICEYLEKGVYTIDMFTKRNASLAKEINQLQSAEADLPRQQGEGKQKK